MARGEGEGLTLTPLELRDRVVALRARYLRGEIDLATLYRAADTYLDACEAKAKHLWPDRKFRRPPAAYIVRAL